MRDMTDAGDDEKKMGSISICKIGITDLSTDAIVNAANEGLWAGGGVCGAIFGQPGTISFKQLVMPSVTATLALL